MRNSPTKVAIFDLTGCDGCEFHLLSLNEYLLDIFQDFKITNWRLLAEGEKKDFDVAFVEGAATTDEHIRLLKSIRQTSRTVIALGACAISGNVFAELTPRQREKLAPKIYDTNYRLKAAFLDPIAKHIKVDDTVPGCPADINKFKAVLTQLRKSKVVSKIKTVSPPDYTAKIEGHGRLKINFKEKKAVFEARESERLIEGLLLGKNYQRAPFINARVCGICPVAHNLCSWKAIEAALEITPSAEAVALREIILAAQIVKSHLLHLFFMVLPDYAGVKSSIKLSLKYPAEFHLMLTIKRVSEKALRTIAGSTVFPLNNTLGGFRRAPPRGSLATLGEEIDQVLDEAQDLIDLFAAFKVPFLETKTPLLSLKPPDGRYPLYRGKANRPIKEARPPHPASTAKLGILETGQAVKTGAIARMRQFNSQLNEGAQKAYQKYQPNLANPFNNNLAQAIEILHFLEEMRRLIGELTGRDLETARAAKTPPRRPGRLRGEAHLEAPRGVLIHRVAIDNQGKIADYNIIPPTQINLAALEKEAQQLASGKEKLKSENLTAAAEKLIRAFDPCITCAVH